MAHDDNTTPTSYQPTPYTTTPYLTLHSLCLERKQKYASKSCVYAVSKGNNSPVSMRVFAKMGLRTPFAWMRGRVCVRDANAFVKVHESVEQQDGLTAGAKTGCATDGAQEQQQETDRSHPRLFIGVCFAKEDLHYHIPNKTDANFAHAVQSSTSKQSKDILHTNGFFTKLGLVQMVDRKTATDANVPVYMTKQEGHKDTYLFHTTSLFCFSFLSNHIHIEELTTQIGRKNCYALAFAIFEEVQQGVFVRVSNPIGNFRLIMTHSAAKPLYSPFSLKNCTTLSEYEKVLECIWAQDEKNMKQHRNGRNGTEVGKEDDDEEMLGEELSSIAMTSPTIVQDYNPSQHTSTFEHHTKPSFFPQQNTPYTSVGALVAAAEAIEHNNSYSGHLHPQLYPHHMEYKKFGSRHQIYTGHSRMESTTTTHMSVHSYTSEVPPQQSRLPSIQEIIANVRDVANVDRRASGGMYHQENSGQSTVHHHHQHPMMHQNPNTQPQQ